LVSLGIVRDTRAIYLVGGRAVSKLQSAAVVYLIGLALHTADHFRRGLDASTDHVFWLGNVSTVLGLAAVTMILTRHRYAPEAAIAFGFPIAFGVAAVHWLPGWFGPFSDSFVDQSMSWMSWAVVAIEIAGAMAVGVYGLGVVKVGNREEIGARLTHQ
jgi:hypothetical protein